MIKKISNPFLLTGYVSPEYFCNRIEETERLKNAIENGRNITLLSLRRMGKTGLIKHFFYEYAKISLKTRLLYVDIMPTNNLNDFIRELGKAILLEEQKRSANYFTKIKDIISSINGKLTFNPLTGAPELELGFKPSEESITDLGILFDYISKQKNNYVIAIDEFQQITYYPEKGIEALIRSYSQQINNVQFIFSGSNKHLLMSMFSDYGRPFYQSTEIVVLERIKKDEYVDFVYKHFVNSKKVIQKMDIEDWIDIYDVYTFYVQYFFNKLYSTGIKTITYELMHSIAWEILKEREYIYFNYKNLITVSQFNLIKAIAKEGRIDTPNAGWFIQKYHLVQPSSVSRGIQSLLDKEMIYKDEFGYKVYDLFFSQWLAQL
ncbi:MAG: ATP-binding protein [Marinilabiliaceae bacterium]|nr:ATP-binding protein [Marinilabiliaceae bacterium]